MCIGILDGAHDSSCPINLELEKLKKKVFNHKKISNILFNSKCFILN